MNTDLKNSANAVAVEPDGRKPSVEVLDDIEKQRSQKIWKERLCALDFERQKRIAVKYYNGHMPWRS